MGLETKTLFYTSADLSDILFHMGTASLVGLLCLLVWFCFLRPFNLFMDFTELGFESVSSDSTKNGGNNHLKRALINELRQRRKTGELPPPYPNGWFAILESDELPLKGVKEISALGQNLVAWRGESGRVYVADAYCPHLGTHLGVGGKVVGMECIQCPFHSWTFQGATGQVENIPYSQSHCLPATARLKMWQVTERHGFIYIWHHTNGVDPTWSLPVIPKVEAGRWKYRGRSEFRVACHIQEIPENGADVHHFNAVHANPALPCGMNLDKEWSFMKHIWTASWAAKEEPGKEHEAISTIEHNLILFNRTFPLLKVSVEAHQIGPGVVHLHFDTLLGRGVLIQNVTPLEPLLQRITHKFYSVPSFIHPAGIAVLYIEAVQVARDIRIWNRKSFLRKPVLTKEDYLINKFRRWYAQFYSEGCSKPTGTECISNGVNVNGRIKPDNLIF